MVARAPNALLRALGEARWVADELPHIAKKGICPQGQEVGEAEISRVISHLQSGIRSSQYTCGSLVARENQAHECGKVKTMAATEPQLSEVPNSGWDVRLRVFRAGDEVDTFALVTVRYIVLVDTMATPELAEGILDRVRPDLQGRQLLVVNTHADWDHCWDNAAFTMPWGNMPAPILGHEVAATRLGGPEERDTLTRKRTEEPRFANVRLVAPTLTFRDGLHIAGGDLTVELLPTPGHTPDHVAVWVPELRLLLAGVAAEHPFPAVYSAKALPVLRGSLERLRALDPARVFPCHGGTTDAGLLTRNLAYFDSLEQAARATILAGRLPGDWETRADLSEVLGLPFETALRAAGAEPSTTSAIYREFHVQATRATLAFVLSQGGSTDTPQG